MPLLATFARPVDGGDAKSFREVPKNVFTFPREREKDCAGDYLHNKDQLPVIHRVIDAAYDLEEGACDLAAAADTIQDALINGGGGVWEQTGSWLAKLAPKYPSLDSIWVAVATHSSANVRFRAAAHICDMSSSALRMVLPLLLADRSKKVRMKVAGDLWVSPRAEAVDRLADRLPNERDEEVAGEIRKALAQTQQTGT